MKKNTTHGGPRKGAGRPKGKKSANAKGRTAITRSVNKRFPNTPLSELRVVTGVDHFREPRPDTRHRADGQDGQAVGRVAPRTRILVYIALESSIESFTDEYANNGDWAAAADVAGSYCVWGIWEKLRELAGLPSDEAARQNVISVNNKTLNKKAAL